MKKFLTLFLCASMILSGCSTMSKTGKGAIIGGGSGAALGAGLGAIIGKDGKSTAIGAAVGSAVGAGVGAIIGKQMDKKAAELAALEGADVETVKDANGLDAIKVTFESGILFNTSSSVLNKASQNALTKFASEMKDLPDTDLTIYGHTDNTGTAEYNEKLSVQRAEAVSSFLKSCGMSAGRMTVEGKSFTMPVADNSTVEGRLQNRRVEIYVTANEEMIKKAENGEI
ncbi:MAG: OmpA family protein [Bacteroidales bacterium]|nr:OmpA family protein [Bacteroidales bacterium]MDD3201992.1 OmpA family protein [Bacteroidales bacterium]